MRGQEGFVALTLNVRESDISLLPAVYTLDHAGRDEPAREGRTRTGARNDARCEQWPLFMLFKDRAGQPAEMCEQAAG